MLREATWCTRWTVGAKKIINFFSPLDLIALPMCSISITAIKVLPEPVSNTAMVFLLLATSKTSNWYLNHTQMSTCNISLSNIKTYKKSRDYRDASAYPLGSRLMERRDSGEALDTVLRSLILLLRVWLSLRDWFWFWSGSAESIVEISAVEAISTESLRFFTNVGRCRIQLPKSCQVEQWFNHRQESGPHSTTKAWCPKAVRLCVTVISINTLENFLLLVLSGKKMKWNLISKDMDFSYFTLLKYQKFIFIIIFDIRWTFKKIKINIKYRFN